MYKIIENVYNIITNISNRGDCMSKRDYTREEKEIMNKVKQSSNNCYYCGCKLNNNQKTIDHKLPMSRGGKTIKDNLVVSCIDCNQDKDSMTEDEFNKFNEIIQKEIDESVSIKYLTTLLMTYKDILDKLEQSKLELKQSYHEVNEIQNIIINTKMSASDGYILCRDLQKALIRKNELQKTVSELTSISEGVIEKYEEINKKINKIKNKIKSQQTVLLFNNTMQ